MQCQYLWDTEAAVNENIITTQSYKQHTYDQQLHSVLFHVRNVVMLNALASMPSVQRDWAVGDPES